VTFLQSIFLGILQGLTEFLPISSSGHLVLAENLFQIKQAGLYFNVMLHMGTLLALILYFWRDWVRYIKAFFRSLRKWDLKNDIEQRLFYLLVLASIPGALFGALLEKQVQTIFRSTALVLVNLFIIALVFIITEKIAKKQRSLSKIGIKDALIIGFSQVLAIIPGISRSGITIVAGMLFGLKREAAARFSFLMATPIIFGAGLVGLNKIIHQGNNSTGWLNMIIGLLSAALIGYLTIKYLLSYLEKHTLNIFAYYRILLVIAVIIYLLNK
jgi:undecaprenyl-diphosphatase